RTAADLLLVVPGVSITQHSGEGKAYQIFFRGFDAIHGQDVEMWAGGAPVNEVSNVHGQGYADLHFLMPEVVRQIASTPGTYDPRQGDFAVAGTLRLGLGYSEPGFTAKASVGSFDTRRYFLAYHPEGSDDETFAAFEVYSTGGFGPSRAARRTSAVAQYARDLGGGLRVRALATVSTGRFDSAGVVLLDDVDRGRIDRFATYDPRQGGDSARTQLVVEATSQGEAGRWSVAPYVVLRQLRLLSNFTGFLESASGDGVQQTNDATTAGFTASYRRKRPLLSARDLIEVGVAGRSDLIEQTQRRLTSPDGAVRSTEVDAKVHAHDAAGYLDLLVYPLRRLSLRGGVRLDGLSYTTRDAGGQVRSAQGAHLGKKGTAEVIVATGLSASVSYGEGFRSPQARGLADGQSAPFTTVRSAEAGLRYRDERLQGSLAVFRTTLSDDLAFDQSTARNERTPPTLRRGVAAEMVARPAPDLTSSLSLTYTRATFRESAGDYEKGALLPYVPQLVGRADLTYEPRLGQVFGRTLSGQVGGGLTMFH
ncbi:MAG: TonB-dependent receptor, partial [Myxococcales bacterium]